MLRGGFTHAMADEEMPAERGGGCETRSTLLTLKAAASITVQTICWRNSSLFLCGKTTRHAAESGGFLLSSAAALLPGLVRLLSANWLSTEAPSKVPGPPSCSDELSAAS